MKREIQQIETKEEENIDAAIKFANIVLEEMPSVFPDKLHINGDRQAGIKDMAAKPSFARNWASSGYTHTPIGQRQPVTYYPEYYFLNAFADVAEGRKSPEVAFNELKKQIETKKDTK